MKLNNVWVGYVERTIAQTKASILSKITNPSTGIPEMTDHTDTNPWVKTINIWTGLLELLHYYLDNAAREVFLPVSRVFAKAALTAELVDYRIKGMIGASVDIVFTINTAALVNIDIPANTEIRTASGIKYFTQSLATIVVGQTSVSVKAYNLQSTAYATIGVSSGLASQKFTLPADVSDSNTLVVINTVQWIAKDTLAYSGPYDQHFVIGLNASGLMELRFGDGLNGVIPATGLDITYSYKKTDGLAGNTPPLTISTLITSITLPSGITITCTNPNSATGGVGAEDLTSLKKNIPIAARTLYRAVTEQDYKEIAMLASGVAKAGVEPYTCGRTIRIYICPDGSVNGIASDGLIASTQAFVDLRKMIGTRVKVESAGIVTIKQTWDIVLRAGYDNTAKALEIKTALAAFMSIAGQDVYGYVERGDLYQIAEGIVGVDYSRLNLLVSMPYARPVEHNHQLTWTRETLPTSTTTVRWTITKVVSGYQLLKDGSNVGNFAWATLVTQPEVSFTPQNNLSAPNGSVWSFYTYKYNDNIQLAEPSIPISEISDITINISGGI